MKRTSRKIAVLMIVTGFLVFGFIGEKADAQTKTSAKTTPTPKTAPKPVSATSKQTNPVFSSQIIVTATEARIRTKASTSSEVIGFSKIGTTYDLVGKNAAWFNVKINENQTGWISKTIAADFNSAKRGETYQSIADKYFKRPALDFATAAELFNFLTIAEKEIKSANLQADLSFKRLLALRAALKAIPFDKSGQKPYKNFTDTNENDVVYSEPSGEWYVRSGRFWELHERSKNLPFGEEIAWQAAQNPIAGECEGYINCYLFLLRSTDGEYLNFYPGGKYSRTALKNITEMLEPIVADSKEKVNYTPPADISDRAEFNKFLAELRTIVSKTPHLEKTKTFKQITELGEAYR